mmetsp:Transcript_31970/g.67220  ORF Transcript_31970/g.67220 Transcript_31970/m.67220 type:complete len:90 (-) Transcript_31970:1803-2072(-)
MIKENYYYLKHVALFVYIMNMQYAVKFLNMIIVNMEEFDWQSVELLDSHQHWQLHAKLTWPFGSLLGLDNLSDLVHTFHSLGLMQSLSK